MNVERRQFDQAYRHADAAPGQSVVVWEERFNRDEPGFIDKIGVDWYELTSYDFFVDGVKVETIERTIQVTEPDEYNPPIRARKRARWIFNNNHPTETFAGGVLCSGFRARNLI